MPVKERLSYGTQLSVLRKPVLWNSFLAALLMNAAMFGFYSYLSDYLITVTDVSFKVISLLLFVYGMANIVGNIAAGKLLAQRPFATLKYVPAIMAILYLVLYGLGKLTIPTSIVILILGIFAGIANNGNQFMVSTSATEAPDFGQRIVPDRRKSRNNVGNGNMWHVHNRMGNTIISVGSCGIPACRSGKHYYQE